ncbi:MAG: UDP-N-acetylglucosamine--N-acetylmuramyl-(pentapeptide) pyrophosphoryl-undecaprenol N-acetylglucosamine transferase [Planctomycetota bacterium]|nr:UDP-N-acetylglucosamine--N-acetylmuramyl-(pentapeptide) pyrophosphoryl-undecaprenol N-acetylglucosamine transferase [Planctomycetota bacterium]
MRETGYRIFLAGGGTGGHLYPGLAIAEAIRRLVPEAAIAFSSTRRDIDRQVLADCGCPVTPIDARPFRRAPWTWPGFVLSLARSGNHPRRRFREFCPDVVIGLGGFGSYAPVRVGQKYGAATAVLNPDIVPGRANRRLARRADRVFCQFAETVAELGGTARLTGCPIRPSLFTHTREEGLAAFGLDPARQTLLVTGASLGARTVNRAVIAMLKDRGLPAGWEVLHLTGHKDYEEVAAAYRGISVPAVVRPYAEKMGLAYAVADLAVARAGASTVAELLAAGVPTVFMPYPFHRDQHQRQQALAVERLGAAAVVEDCPADPDGTWCRLAEVLGALMKDKARLDAMRERARAAGRPQAAEVIAREILDLAAAVTDRRHAAWAAGREK